MYIYIYVYIYMYIYILCICMYIYGDFIGNIIYEVLMEKSLNYINELRFPAGRVWLPKGTRGWERVTHGFFWPLLKRLGMVTHPESSRHIPEDGRGDWNSLAGSFQSFAACSRGNDCLQADHKFSDTRSTTFFSHKHRRELWKFI